MFTISKSFPFSAAHHLEHLPEGHKCKRVHGHNYVVRLTLESRELNKDSFVVDYSDLSKVKDWLDEEFDHRDLNDFILIPTAENIAMYIFGIWKANYDQLVSVTVSETPNTEATYEPRR